MTIIKYIMIKKNKLCLESFNISLSNLSMASSAQSRISRSTSGGISIAIFYPA